MVKKKLLYIILFALISFYFQGNTFAAWRTGLPHDPNWLVDEELVRFSPGWNKGHIKVRAARGGVNKIVENQEIINSWGYKARPIEEIEDLLPEAIYNMYCHPEQWGTIRINETPWEAVKPRGSMWEKFLAQSEKNKKNVYLDERGWMRNYRWGIPFPDLDEKDPQIGLKLVWNYYKRYQDNDRVLRMDVAVKDRGGGERHNMMLNQRLQMSGRTRGDKNTEDGLYLPNPKNIEFVYAAPYVAPYNMRGTIALYYRYNDPDRDDDMWVYIPSIRRIRRLSTNQHQDRCPGGFDWTWDNTEGF